MAAGTTAAPRRSTQGLSDDLLKLAKGLRVQAQRILNRIEMPLQPAAANAGFGISENTNSQT